jgi:hypothetical protein
MENSFHFFPLWKRGMKGDFTAVQKAKLLPQFQMTPGIEKKRIEKAGEPG